MCTTSTLFPTLQHFPFLFSQRAPVGPEVHAGGRPLADPRGPDEGGHGGGAQGATVVPGRHQEEDGRGE